METRQAHDDDILCLVNCYDIPDAADDDDDAPDDDDNNTQPTEVTTMQAREMITRLIPYFEQTTEQTTSDERRENAAFFDQLWAMADVIQKRSTTRSKQTTIANFLRSRCLMEGIPNRPFQGHKPIKEKQYQGLFKGHINSPKRSNKLCKIKYVLLEVR